MSRACLLHLSCLWVRRLAEEQLPCEGTAIWRSAVAFTAARRGKMARQAVSYPARSSNSNDPANLCHVVLPQPFWDPSMLASASLQPLIVGLDCLSPDQSSPGNHLRSILPGFAQQFPKETNGIRICGWPHVLLAINENVSGSALGQQGSLVSTTLLPRYV